jgi:hypothetical protein
MSLLKKRNPQGLRTAGECKDSTPFGLAEKLRSTANPRRLFTCTYIYKLYIYVCLFRILIVDFDVANDLHIYYGCRYYHHDDYSYDYCRYEFSITYTQAPEVS